MIIAQISDTHIDPNNPDAASRIRNLEQCVRDINQLDESPDVVIHTGDLAHNGTPEKYLEAARVLETLCCPLFIAAGNRDDRIALSSIFPESCSLCPDSSFIQYSIDKFPVRLIAADTLSETSNMGGFCKLRADNLRLLLSENPSKPTAIFMHHPPFEIHASKHNWHFNSAEAIAKFEQTLDGAGQVKRIFCGHSHRDVEGVTAGVPASCTPSVAVNLRVGDFPNSDSTDPVYQLHRFDINSGFISQTRIAG